MEKRVGISGWRYKGWRGVFYPKELPQRRELEYASRQVNSIEINGSFYSLQRPESYQSWYQQTPDNFVFAVKGPRYITHIRRLKESREPLANFFASGVLHLQKKLGPLLWQLPPNFVFDPKRLIEFFSELPRNFSEASQLATKSTRLKASVPRELPRRKIKHALEVRHHSFENPLFVEILREYDIALVFADTAGKWPYMEDVTTDFIYIRLHGEKEIYRSGYEDPSLRFWASRINCWQMGIEPKNALTLSDKNPKMQKRDIYVYFDNDIKVRAPRDAIRLHQMLTKTTKHEKVAS